MNRSKPHALAGKLIEYCFSNIPWRYHYRLYCSLLQGTAASTRQFGHPNAPREAIQLPQVTTAELGALAVQSLGSTATTLEVMVLVS